MARYAGRAPAWFDLTGAGIVSGTSCASVCLTLDACGGSGGSGVDEDLVDLLLGEALACTVFLNSRWVEANPATTDRLAAAPHIEIGNHGTAHRPLSVTGAAAYGITGTASVGEVYDEVMGAQELLTRRTGTAPRLLRPGTAYWDDVAVAVATDLGLTPAGFSVNGDGGATFTRAQVVTQVGGAGPGDVVITHLNQPTAATGAGLREVIPTMLAGGTTFATLSQALGR